LLALALTFKPVVSGTITEIGDPLTPQATAGHEANPLFGLGKPETVTGLSTVDGRDVLVISVDADANIAQLGEAGQTVRTKGFMVIDLATGATLSSLVQVDLKLGKPHPDARGFTKITSRYLTEADRPRRDR